MIIADPEFTLACGLKRRMSFTTDLSHETLDLADDICQYLSKSCRIDPETRVHGELNVCAQLMTAVTRLEKMCLAVAAMLLTTVSDALHLILAG